MLKVYKINKFHSYSLDNIKLADFGLSKKVSFMQRRKSNSISSLWYRPPEILLGSESYFYEVDVWSAGCVFVDLLIMRPMFALCSEKKVIEKMFKLYGTPNLKRNSFALQLKKFEELSPLDYYDEPCGITYKFPEIDPVAADLLEKMLEFDPKKRITAREALFHEYFK